MKRYIIRSIVAISALWITTAYALESDISAVTPPATSPSDEEIKSTGFTKSPDVIAREWSLEWDRESTKKAEQGDGESQFMLGRIAYVRQDYAEALKWYKKAATHPAANKPKDDLFIDAAQEALALIYLKGDGAEKNYHEAFKWLRMLANKNNSWAQYNIGVMYLNGLGIRQNQRIAKEWFGKACDNGYQPGCDRYRELKEQGFKSMSVKRQ